MAPRLSVLGASYEEGTAAHLDVSYRATKAMLRNRATDPNEFRRMVERDVAWFFKLLPLCPNLRLLLIFGPIVGEMGRPESLVRFVHAAAPDHGFRVFQESGFWKLRHEPTAQVVTLHDADTPGEKCITCRVTKNLHAHRADLLQKLQFVE